MITLLALKNRKADLRIRMIAERKTMGAVSEKTFIDYEITLALLRRADTQILHTRCNNQWFLE